MFSVMALSGKTLYFTISASSRKTVVVLLIRETNNVGHSTAYIFLL
jgi:hypothetical protein